MPDQEQAAKSAPNKWRDFSKEQPENEQDIWVYASYYGRKEIWIGYYKDTDNTFNVAGIERGFSFRYWQPIERPAPPQFDEQGELKQ